MNIFRNLFVGAIALALGGNVALADAGSGIIAINFNARAQQVSQSGSVTSSGSENNWVVGNDSGALDYVIPATVWKQLEGRQDWGTKETATVYDYETQQSDSSRTAKVGWNAANIWAWTGCTAKILNGYLDDSGSGATVTVTEIPFAKYDVIFYAATDAENKKFGAPEINGKRYTYASGETVEGDAAWGASLSKTAAYGTNALRVNGLSGDLTVKGYGNNKAGYRGGIAAIVIVEGETSGDDPAPYDGPVADAVWVGEDLDGATKGDYSLKLNGNSYANGAITISGNSGVLIDWDTASTGPFTVIVKYENLNLNSSSEQVLATVKDGSHADHVGVHLQVNNADNVKGVWLSNTYQNAHDVVEPMPAAGGIFTLGYKRDSGTQLFYQATEGGATEKVYESTDLRSSGSTYSGVAIGGKRGGGWAASDMKITAIALFTGKRLTAEELVAYRFSEPPFVFENTDCDPSSPGYGNYTPATLTIPETADLPIGTKLRIKSITFAMRVDKSPASSSAEYLTINGVQSESRNGLTETPETWSLGNRMTYEFTEDAIVTVGEAATLGTVKGNGGSSDIRIYIFRTTEDKYGYILLTTAMETYRPVYKIVAEKVAGPVPEPKVELLYDWTFDGTSLVSKGSAMPVTLTSESTPVYLEDEDFYVYGKALNTASTPWGNITYPATTWSAVVSGIMPTVKGSPLVTFGTKKGGEIGIIVGDSDREVLLIRTTKDEAYSTLGSVTVENAQTATHVYVIVRKSNCIMLYVDGAPELNVEVSNDQVGGGLQVGSVNGGVTAGITKVDANNVGYSAIEAIRIYRNELTEDDLNKLSDEFPIRAVAIRDPMTIYWKGGDGAIDGGATFEDEDGNEVKYISGDEIVIDGTCNVTLSRSVGELRVKNGAVLQVGSAGNVTTKLYIDAGGTFDVNGVPNITYPIVLNGGTLANYGEEIDDGKRQYWNLEVTADSFINAQNDFGTIASNHSSQTLELGGHKLTKLGVGKFYMSNVTFEGGGTLDIRGGIVVLRSGTTLPNNLTVKVGSNGETISGGTGFAIKSGKITFDISEALKLAANEITLLDAKTTVTAEKFALTGLPEDPKQNWQIQIENDTIVKAVNEYVLLRIGGVAYSSIEAAFKNVRTNGASVEIVDTERLAFEDGVLKEYGEGVDLAPYAVELNEGEAGAITVNLAMAEGASLIITEVMPKSTDAVNHGALESYDVNGLASGWVEVKNTSDKWVDLKDYKFIRVNRSKANSKGDYGNFPSRLVAPNSLAIFYTSERYANSADMSVSAFATPVDAKKPHIFTELNDVLVWPDKVNPKKFPFVRLYYAPNGEEEKIVDTIVIPSDLPEGMSIIVEPVEEGKATVRYICEAPTRGRENPSTDSLVKLGPNVGPLYEVAGVDKKGNPVIGAAHNTASEFDALVPMAVAGENYEITFALNPTMSPTEAVAFREEDEITGIKLIYRKDLDDATLDETVVDLEAKATDATDMGDTYKVSIPSDYFPAAGHLIQWKFEITDAAGNTWISPSFHNPDDGYEWYGTIVEPTTEQMATGGIPTWHMFVDDASKSQMDVDADSQDHSVVPNQARVAIYDSSTSTYYDYVRIDLRGHTSARFTKKGHGLRFSKAHPLTMPDPVSGGQIKEIRKTSLISEHADPSYVRQMLGFWLWRKMGNNTPFDFPVYCNLNGEFFQVAFNSERFTDELIEDVYGFDKFGYGYKNVGTLKSGGGTSAGSIEKKTPDDEDEKNITVLQNELRKPLADLGVNNVSGTSEGAKSSVMTDPTGLDNPELTKFVVEKFDLAAWINYLASARITQECDDVWANVCMYYDNPAMLEGVRGTGTWMPLGYDFNVSLGQHYTEGGTSTLGLMANQDWFKSHPFYGGNRVRCWNSSMSSPVNEGNRGFEAVWQSAKFRRLYLRRLRTLMDQELGAPNADETYENSTTPFVVKMREMVEMMGADANKDRAKWPWDGSFSSIDVWGRDNFPATMEAGVKELYESYIVPRRVHLFETHSIHNDNMVTGYGTNLKAGIPDAQSAIEDLKDGFSAEVVDGGVVIRNSNDETIDLSGWKMSGPVAMTLPSGTVIDKKIGDKDGEVFVVVDRRQYVADNTSTLTDEVIIGNAEAGDEANPIGLTSPDGINVFATEKSEQELYLRLWGFAGAPDGAEGTDANEFIVFTNLNQEASLDASGAHIQFEKYGATPEGRCSFDLPAGTIIEAGGWVRFNQADIPWTKITDGFQEIVLTDANGIEIERFSNLDQSTIIGGKGSGKMAVHNLETDEWYAILITEAPGYEPPPPPPPMPLTWADTNVTELVTLPAGYNYSFANVNFEGGLAFEPGEYEIKNDGKDSVNSAAFVSAAGASITFVGKGRFELNGEDVTNSLFTAKDLYITKGTFAINTSNETAKVAAVSLTGNFGLSGEGKLEMNLTGNQPVGIELTNKKMNADFTAGSFTAVLDGTKASAFKFKGSDAVTLSGGTMDVVIEGTGAKVLNGGTIVFEDGYVCNIEGDKEAIDATVFEAGKTLTVNGGVFDISVPGAGSQIFTTADDPEEKDLTLTINGGEFNLLAGDDCVKSAGNDAVTDPESVNKARNVVITGGNFYGVSLGNDVIDSNGDIIITGGNILAYTTAIEGDGNGSTGLDVNVGRTITVEGGNVIAIGGPNSSFHYEEGVAFTVDGLAATDWSDKFVELDGKAGKFNTRVWAKIPELDVDKISLFFFTPGIDPAKLPTATTEPPSEEYATGFHDLYIDDVPPGELVITKICARCQPNVPEAKDLGWILLENVGGKPLELSDYMVYCVNRGKKLKPEEGFTLPEGTLDVGATFKVWTSESPVEALPDDATPLYAKKINQKKYPMIQLYKGGAVTQTVLVPVDLADELVYDAAADRRPTISPLYGVKDAPDPWQAFMQAKLGEGYSVTLPLLPADMSAADEDQIASAKLIYQIGFGPIQTNATEMTKSETKDKMNGWTYTGTIPGAALTNSGELVRFAVAITDNAGRTFRAPSFQNPDDGYEWYGTIVEPADGMTDAKVQTFYLFADDASLVEMDKDVDKQDTTKVPYNARVGIYDALTGLYYDNVRIDLRGNTTARFPKKSHGLRFSKAQPLSCTDPVTGTVFEEIRKTSLVADYMDPAYIRQSLSFWLFREAGAKAPYDYPVKLNLNGEFYQLAWNSNRFTDELIEDVYGLDPLGYAFKNCGALLPGHRSSITTEKKTPDDENESDISVEKAFENTLPYNGNDEAVTAENEDAKYTQNVVNTFDLPAWLNYMAMTRITSETDDTWSNISLYYDINGTGTWMPLAYDCHLSFGAFFCHDGKNGARADVDFFKSHPFYGGRRVHAHNNSFEGGIQTADSSNSGLESIYQSPKFRRLYLRRLRTLMDEILEAPGTARENSKIGGYIKLITDATAELAAQDRAKWPLSGIYNFQNDSMNCWPNVASMTPAMGIEDLWNNYVEPRRVHLFVTHSVHNTEKGVGYNNRLSAGIPDKQTAIEDLRAGITAEYDAAIGAVVIRNANEETIDLSNWELSGPVTMTIPAGTVLDQAIEWVPGEVYVTADRRATIAAMTITDQVVVGNGAAGAADAKITLTAADGTKVIFEPSPAYNFLRLHSFDGITPTPDGDTDEWITFTNRSNEVALDLAGVKVVFLKDGDPLADAKCVVTFEAGTTLAASESLTLKQGDYKWKKITNGKLNFYLTDADGMPVQSLYINQKDAAYKNYYGEGGPGGAFYLQATTFAQESEAFIEVAYPVTEIDVKPGEPAEVEAESAEAAIDKAMLVVEVPTEVEALITEEAYKAYFKLAAKEVETGKKYAVSAVLNPETVPEPEIGAIDDEAEPLIVKEGDGGTIVAVGIVNARIGLWYGFEVEATGDLEEMNFENDCPSFKLATNSTEKLVLESSPREGASAFFRTKISGVKPEPPKRDE